MIMHIIIGSFKCLFFFIVCFIFAVMLSFHVLFIFLIPIKIRNCRHHALISPNHVTMQFPKIHIFIITYNFFFCINYCKKILKTTNHFLVKNKRYHKQNFNAVKLHCFLILHTYTLIIIYVTLDLCNTFFK